MRRYGSQHFGRHGLELPSHIAAHDDACWRESDPIRVYGKSLRTMHFANNVPIRIRSTFDRAIREVSGRNASNRL